PLIRQHGADAELRNRRCHDRTEQACRGEHTGISRAPLRQTLCEFPQIERPQDAALHRPRRGQLPFTVPPLQCQRQCLVEPLSRRRILQISLVTRRDNMRHRDKKGRMDMKTRNKHQHAGGEVTELANETAAVEQYWVVGDRSEPRKPPRNYNYVEEIMHLQIELIKMQECVRHNRLRMCVIFEGRDAAGKGGVIKRITDPLNPRVCRVVALATPTERERGQWYFQRYVAELPSAGEIVLFDRSWYNRASVERVMGFCTEDEYQEFLRSCPLFEEMLVRSGIILVK